MTPPKRQMRWWEPLLVVSPRLVAAAGACIGVGSIWALGSDRPLLAGSLLGLALAAAAAAFALHRQRRDGNSPADSMELRARTTERLTELGFTVLELHGGLLMARRPWEALLVEIDSSGQRHCGVGKVRDLYGRIGAHSVNGCILVVTGDFTEPARRYAAGKPILLWDGRVLADPTPTRAPADQSPPTCHSCGAPMRLRKRRSDPAATRPFLGCSRWPECKATRSLPAGVEIPGG